jgi:hypothetical protein
MYYVHKNNYYIVTNIILEIIGQYYRTYMAGIHFLKINFRIRGAHSGYSQMHRMRNVSALLQMSVRNHVPLIIAIYLHYYVDG